MTTAEIEAAQKLANAAIVDHAGPVAEALALSVLKLISRCEAHEAAMVMQGRKVAFLDEERDRLAAQVESMRGFVRHKRDCQINPGGKIMAALGKPEPHPCTCGLDAALAGAEGGA